MHVAGGVVVGIEKVGVLRDLGAVPLHPDFHDEGLEKPARVREMPFRRTHVGHRLDDVIFRFETPAKMRAEIAHLPELFNQALGAAARRSGRRARFALSGHHLGHEGIRRLQESALLRELFLAGFEHLVVRGFLNSVGHELLAQILFVFHARRAMAGR